MWRANTHRRANHRPRPDNRREAVYGLYLRNLHKAHATATHKPYETPRTRPPRNPTIRQIRQRNGEGQMLGRKRVRLRCKEPKCTRPVLTTEHSYCACHANACQKCGKRIWRHATKCRECWFSKESYDDDLKKMLAACREHENEDGMIGEAARDIIRRWS